MVKKLEGLSKNEWALMKICWEKGEVPARVIYDESLKSKKREYQTIKTMLDRLVDKGYLTSRRFGPMLLFKPAVSRARILTKAIDSFVDTVLDNTLAPLFTHFVKNEKLDPEELDALEELIRKSREK